MSDVVILVTHSLLFLKKFELLYETFAKFEISILVQHLMSIGLWQGGYIFLGDVFKKKDDNKGDMKLQKLGWVSR